MCTFFPQKWKMDHFDGVIKCHMVLQNILELARLAYIMYHKNQNNSQQCSSEILVIHWANSYNNKHLLVHLMFYTHYVGSIFKKCLTQCVLIMVEWRV